MKQKALLITTYLMSLQSLLPLLTGAIINETDLIEAIKSGQIGGAGLDVVETEPISPANPLLNMDNVILLHLWLGILKRRKKKYG